MNKFLDSLKRQTNFTKTENGATAHKSTLNKVYDMFAFGGAYRTRSDEDCILLFKNALEQNQLLAIKCLFYMRDCRGGQGERRFFRVCYKWLCEKHPSIAEVNLELISEYGRWDDLIYTTIGTPLEKKAMVILKRQFDLDMDCKTPSLLGKWLPSINASSKTTIKTGHIIRKTFNMTNKEYRKALASLRTKINIVEKLMSENRWDEIEFDKIPSKAGLKYRNAFAVRDIIAKKYEKFAKDENTKVNAATLYPYEIVKQALDKIDWNYENIDEVNRAMLNKYWENLPDYVNNSDMNAICVCDTSGSMTSTYGTTIRPIDVAISLSLYMAERNKGDFANHYISFSSKPQLIECEGIDFVDKVRRIYDTNLIENTNLDAVFALLKETALKSFDNEAGLPSRIIVISDMEIDQGAAPSYWNEDCSYQGWTEDNAQTNMERIRQEWAAVGLKLPKLVYWNVCARNNIILDCGDDVSFVSGASPVLFEQICKGVTGIELMLDKLNSTRYDKIK